MTEPATTRCPECGGPFTAEATCTDRYHACMALELTDPAYGAVHHFTVPAYMLQHPSHLSAAGWQAMAQILHDFLVAGVSPARMRQLIRQQQKMQPKSFSLVKGGVAERPFWPWRKTIMDLRLDDPATYCADVRAWAEAVHHNIQQLDSTGLNQR
ncbi:MAG: hypothetical protein KC445_07835 [Anaerolineales bacterium]|nr:hypothetical protein [Anaerolineales bacterium]